MGSTRHAGQDWSNPIASRNDYDNSMAKQRASVMWIVQKANKNKVPAEYQDPYYRDHENREHLKPGIVSQLANADLYCSALANIYGDPNFFSLSHWKVIQALARKGVYVAEPTDVALNETILLQDSPIKMSAHLAVIEAMMALYIREVVVAERVVSALQKITGSQGTEPTPQDQEEALVLWVAKVTSSLQDRIASQLTDNTQEMPQFPRIQDLSDLSDGIGLAALVSFYCPQELHWGDIAVADPPSMADSLYNIGLVITFCHEALPYNPCLLTKEDIVYMHSCVKQNVLAFVTELFFLLELQPVSCVTPSHRRVSASKYTSPSAGPTLASTDRRGSSSTVPSRQSPERRGSNGSAIISSASHSTLKRQHSLASEGVADAITAPDAFPGLKRQCSATNLEEEQNKRSAQGVKAAGAPSVRRSHSMTLNDVGGSETVGERAFPPSRPRGMVDQRHQQDHSSSHSDYGGRESSMSDGQDGDFVVQRARGVSTLNDMIRTNRGSRSNNDYRDDDTQSWYDPRHGGRRSVMEDDTGSRISQEDDTQSFRMYRRDSQYGSIQDLQQTEKLPPAGMPSRFENRPQGRSRSRRNSISAEESQLTVENFGGSQDNLNDFLSRNVDKEPVGHMGRRDSYQKNNNVPQIDNRVLDKLQREALEREKREFMFGSKNAFFPEDPSYTDPPPPVSTNYSQQQQDSDTESDHSSKDKMSKATSFAELSKIKEQLPSGGINIIYMQGDKGEKKSKNEKKATSFAALPTQTTWKQQIEQSQPDDNKHVTDENMEPQMMASELHNVRLKLEEKRRRIESEKRKMESVLSKQREKMGKEAFMQAVVKGDIGADMSQMSKRWLEGGQEDSAPDVHTPDMEGMDYDQCHQSLNQMTDSLSEIQGDIQRLSSQQQQIQGMLRNGSQPQQQFYLHDQSPGGGGRRMWGDAPPPVDHYNSPNVRRAQWGPARPVPGHGGPDFYSHQQGPPPPPGGGYYPPMGYQQQQLPPIQQSPGGFMLHGQHHSMPQQPPYLQNGAQDPHMQYRGPPYPPQYHPQDGRGGGPPGAPFRLHSEEDSNRGPSSLRGSVQNSPNRQILQQHPAYQQQQQQQQQQQYFNNSNPYSTQYSPNTPYNQYPGPNGHNSQHPPSSAPSRQSVSPARSVTKQEQHPSSMIHAPVAAPPPDDMEPQNVSFIDSSRDALSQERDDRNGSLRGSEERSTPPRKGGEESPTAERLKRLSIGSGSRTYRITNNDRTSPTRPTVCTKTFRVPTKRGTPMMPDTSMDPRQRSLSPPYQGDSKESSPLPDVKTEPLKSSAKPDKGFYISFDDDAPVKPKPALRSKKFTRKSSTPTTPVSTPSREDFSLMQDSSPSLRTSRLPSTPSLDLPSPLSPSKRQQSPFASSLSPSSPGPTNGFPYSTDSTAESSEDLPAPPAEVAGESSSGVALVIGSDLLHQDESQMTDMERKKQRLMINAMKRKQQQEESKRAKELEAEQKREKEKMEEERKMKKKEEEKMRRELILEKHKIKKAIEEAEKEGRYYQPPAWYLQDQQQMSAPSKSSSVKMRARQQPSSRPRPKTMIEGDSTDGANSSRILSNRKRGSTHNVNEGGGGGGSSMSVRKSAGRWGSSHSLSRAAGSRGSTNSLSGDYPLTTRTLDRRTNSSRPTSVAGSLSRGQSTKSLYGSRSRLADHPDDGPDNYRVHAAPRRPSVADHGGGRGPSSRLLSGPRRPMSTSRRYRSTGNLSGASEHDSLVYGMSEDSGLGRSTPPRRAPSPGMGGGAVGGKHLPSPSQPGSLPPGLITRRRHMGFDDAASDISTTSSTMDFTGPRLYKQPAAKSNRPIVLNAVEFCVFPGAVNESNKIRVMEEIARSESKHFLFLFRDSGCQFRALYSYNLELEEVDKLYGTGPKRITDSMFDKFFKYNSGGKSFSQVHTRHLTATIDAFTIHNSLWQGRKVSLHNRKDYALVV